MGDIFLGGTVRPGTVDPITDARDAIDGWRSVSSAVARLAIPVTYLRKGMVVVDQDTLVPYQLTLLSPVTWVPLSIGGGGGTQSPLIAKGTATTNVVSLSGTTIYDGVSFGVDDRIFLSNLQTDPLERGLWQIQAGAWVRPTEFPVGDAVANTLIYTQEGLSLGDRLYQCTSDPPNDIVGTSPLSFKFVVDAGLGITVTNGQIAVNTTTNFVGANKWTGSHEWDANASFNANVILGSDTTDTILFKGAVGDGVTNNLGIAFREPSVAALTYQIRPLTPAGGVMGAALNLQAGDGGPAFAGGAITAVGGAGGAATGAAFGGAGADASLIAGAGGIASSAFPAGTAGTARVTNNGGGDGTLTTASGGGGIVALNGGRPGVNNGGGVGAPGTKRPYLAGDWRLSG